MKYIEASESPSRMPTVELTRHNLEILLEKLDDPLSARTIMKDGWAVRAIEADGVVVAAVENDAHYAAEGREPGEMFMPSTGVIK
jgi:hypothetical protein